MTKGGGHWSVGNDGLITVTGRSSTGKTRTQATMEGFVPDGYYADPGKTPSGQKKSPYQHFRIAYNPAADALAGGFGSGVVAASNGVKGIANSAGLMVGQVWARGVGTGADSVLTKADFVAAAIPQLGSELAKAALGMQSMLGPAGSGAMVSKVPSVNLGGGSPAQATIHNHLYIDSKEIRLIAGQEVEATLGDLVSSISRQSG